MGPFGPDGWQPFRGPDAAHSPTPAVTAAAITMAMTQPRTVRNLVHSACTSRPKLSRSSCGVRPERSGVIVAVIASLPQRPEHGTRRRRG